MFEFMFLSFLLFSNYCYDYTLPYRLYRAELQEQGARDVERMVEKGFAKWFKCHVSQYIFCL